jgi:hypothetical protein
MSLCRHAPGLRLTVAAIVCLAGCQNPPTQAPQNVAGMSALVPVPRAEKIMMARDEEEDWTNGCVNSTKHPPSFLNIRNYCECVIESVVVFIPLSDWSLMVPRMMELGDDPTASNKLGSEFPKMKVIWGGCMRQQAHTS